MYSVLVLAKANAKLLYLFSLSINPYNRTLLLLYFCSLGETLVPKEC